MSDRRAHRQVRPKSILMIWLSDVREEPSRGAIELTGQPRPSPIAGAGRVPLRRRRPRRRRAPRSVGLAVSAGSGKAEAIETSCGTAGRPRIAIAAGSANACVRRSPYDPRGSEVREFQRKPLRRPM